MMLLTIGVATGVGTGMKTVMTNVYLYITHSTRLEWIA